MILFETPRFRLVDQDDWDRKWVHEVSNRWCAAIQQALAKLGIEDSQASHWEPNDVRKAYHLDLYEFDLCRQVDSGVWFLLKTTAIKDDITTALAAKQIEGSEKFAGLFDMFFAFS